MQTPPLVEANGLGVSYPMGLRRDDVQAMAYRMLSGSLRRGEFWALQDVTFTASAGQVLGIIGRNGSGKTTLCRALAGLVKPDAGAVQVRGAVSSLLSLGTGFNKELTGRENILLNGLMLGAPREQVQARADDIVEFAGIGRFIDQPLKFYSHGMRSRLGFSIAAMLEPEILVIDETLSVGDLDFTTRAGQRMRELVGRAGLVILVSHQPDVIKQYCTHAMWLDSGRIRARGTPDEVVAEYYESVPLTSRNRLLSALSRGTRPAPGKPVISVEHASVSFDLRPSAARAPSAASRFWALDHVSLSVREGEVVGVIGRNGAGKTTLCRLLAGVLKPDTGVARVDGKVTAMLSFSAGLNHQLSGADNIQLTGRILGMSRERIQAVFDDVVEFSELGPFIWEPVKHYSRGMRARLAFSTVTAIEPHVLLIDEALSVGDAAFAAKAAARIEALISRATAVFIVTHSLEFITGACTRAIWLKDGKIAFDGPPGEAVERYRAAHARPRKKARTALKSAGRRAASAG